MGKKRAICLENRWANSQPCKKFIKQIFWIGFWVTVQIFKGFATKERGNIKTWHFGNGVQQQFGKHTMCSIFFLKITPLYYTIILFCNCTQCKEKLFFLRKIFTSLFYFNLNYMYKSIFFLVRSSECQKKVVCEFWRNKFTSRHMRTIEGIIKVSTSIGSCWQ